MMEVQPNQLLSYQPCINNCGRMSILGGTRCKVCLIATLTDDSGRAAVAQSGQRYTPLYDGPVFPHELDEGEVTKRARESGVTMAYDNGPRLAYYNLPPLEYGDRPAPFLSWEWFLRNLPFAVCAFCVLFLLIVLAVGMAPSGGR